MLIFVTVTLYSGQFAVVLEVPLVHALVPLLCGGMMYVGFDAVVDDNAVGMPLDCTHTYE